jgi:hypothetical protein
VRLGGLGKSKNPLASTGTLPFLTTALDGSEYSTLGRFIHLEGGPGTNWIGVWVGTEASSYVVE